MKRVFSTLTIVLLTSLTVNAKVIFIDIEKTLREAEKIKIIFVIAYNDSTMFYKFQNSNDTLSISCETKKTSEPFRQTLIDKKVMFETDLAGKWPSVGQKVLIVISKNNNVILFATKTGDDYRFWNPNSVPLANSIFLIPKVNPYKPLDYCNDMGKLTDNKFWSCADGCLFGASSLKERG